MELAVTPKQPVARGARFSVDVGYTGAPHSPSGTQFAPGWYRSPGGWVVALQPSAAHTVLPVDDTPCDKTSYTFVLTLPAGTTAVANGTLTGRATSARETRWTYEMQEPLAAELIQIAVGRFAVVRQEPTGGVVLRTVVPTRERAALDPVLRRTCQLPRSVVSCWASSKMTRASANVCGVRSRSSSGAPTTRV
jgi:aminopeptidase N